MKKIVGGSSVRDLKAAVSDARVKAELLKSRTAELDGDMPIDRYLDGDPLENHPLFKSEEQARVEETMDGVHPDFSDETLDDVGLGMWPSQSQQAAAVADSLDQPQELDVEDATAENAAPVPEESGFWNSGGARDFDWGD